jgi:hypothetical protein
LIFLIFLGAVLGATGTLVASSGASSFNPLLSEMGALMTIKCDVTVLSDYKQVFRLLDAILEANLWPQETEDLN